MSKYLKILTEEKERILNSYKKHFLYELNPNKWGKPLNEEAQIIKPEGDPFAYMKSGDTYYHINVGKTGEKPSETDERWQQETRDTAIYAIKTQIFSGDSTTTTTETGTTPENTTDLSSEVSTITKDKKWKNFPCVPLSWDKSKDKSRMDTSNNVIFSIDGIAYFNEGIYCNDKNNNTNCFVTEPLAEPLKTSFNYTGRTFKCNGKKIEKL